MAAGIATLRVLKKSDYAALEARVRTFTDELAVILREKGLPVVINQIASMFTVFFTEKPIRNFEDVKNSDVELFGRFFKARRERNIFLGPSAFEVSMVSFMHSDADFEATLEAARSIRL